MSARYREPDQADIVIIELDGPLRAYFEIPLDYWATPNGELEAESHPEASRLTQRVVYINFDVADPLRARTVTERVTQRLKELGGGYIWWRLRPTVTQDQPPRLRLRLGTTPELPRDWWQRLSQDVENLSTSNRWIP
jgi:hypothetical protein